MVEAIMRSVVSHDGPAFLLGATLAMTRPAREQPTTYSTIWATKKLAGNSYQFQ
jgi:hypothetical protein